MANGLAERPGTWKEQDWESDEKDILEKYADRSLQMGEGCDDTCAPCKCSSEVTSAEEFNNQEVEMTPSMDHQPLSPVILIEWGMIL